LKRAPISQPAKSSRMAALTVVIWDTGLTSTPTSVHRQQSDAH
jgi:hypothetical protein